MKTEVEIKVDPKQLAEMLFDLDSIEVGQVFKEWKLLFDKNFMDNKDQKGMWIHSLNAFMYHVVNDLDDDGIEFFREAYASVLYKYCNDINKSHLTKLSNY